MSEESTTVSALVALSDRGYTEAIKGSLRDDESWAVFLDPLLVNRTRSTLSRIAESIDSQKSRIIPTGTASPEWLSKTSKLRGYIAARLVPLMEQDNSGAREARAWRAFSARLVEALDKGDQEALDTLRTPYGNLTAREWLYARKEKKA